MHHRRHWGMITPACREACGGITCLYVVAHMGRGCGCPLTNSPTHTHTRACLLSPQPEQRYFAIVREPADMLYAAHQPMHALGLSVPLTSHFRPPFPVTSYSRFRHFHLRKRARERAHSGANVAWDKFLLDQGMIRHRRGRVVDASGVPQLFHQFVRQELTQLAACIGRKPDDPQHHWECIGAGDIRNVGMDHHEAMNSFELLTGVYVYWLGYNQHLLL